MSSPTTALWSSSDATADPAPPAGRPFRARRPPRCFRARAREHARGARARGRARLRHAGVRRPRPRRRDARPRAFERPARSEPRRRTRARAPARSRRPAGRSRPDLPTLDEALAFCADRLPGIGLQLDLKRRGIEAGDRRGAAADTACSTARGSAPSTPGPSGGSRSSSPSCRAPTRCRAIASGSRSAARSRRSCDAALGSIGASLPRRLPELLARARAVRGDAPLLRLRPRRRSTRAHEARRGRLRLDGRRPEAGRAARPRRRRRNHHERSADLYDVHGVKRLSLLSRDPGRPRWSAVRSRPLRRPPTSRAAIPLGVTIGGVQVGGLAPDAATAAVQQAFDTPLELATRIDADPRHARTCSARRR